LVSTVCGDFFFVVCTRSFGGVTSVIFSFIAKKMGYVF
jgi:hypothetical protein